MLKWYLCHETVAINCFAFVYVTLTENELLKKFFCISSNSLKILVVKDYIYYKK